MPIARRIARLLALVAVFIVATPSVAHADSIREREWHLGFLKVTEAQRQTKGEGVTVAVIDSGVDATHPDLRGALLKGRTFAGGRDDGWDDGGGHGTAMASLIAGRGHGPGNQDGVLGIAPAAKILPVRTTTGGPDNTRIDLGIEWAAKHGADVLSISLGDFDLPEIKEAVEFALSKGIVIVAAAGNTEKGDDEVMAPAMYPGVIAVSGTDQEGYFSESSVSGQKVVLAAPATDVVSARQDGAYGSATGTSNSTAIVAGVAALIKSKYPELDAANVIQRLIATADDRGPDGRDSQYGFGVVDPVAALTTDVPKVDANPLITPPKTTGKPSRSAAAGGAARGSGTTFAVVGLGLAGGAVVVGIVALAWLRRRTRTGVAPQGAPQQQYPPGGP